jgi:hypothetical protein
VLTTGVPFRARSWSSATNRKPFREESNRERERREWLEEGERLKDLEEDFSAAKLERKREAVIPAVSRSRGQR